jgi:hypothetical protein
VPHSPMFKSLKYSLAATSLIAISIIPSLAHAVSTESSIQGLVRQGHYLNTDLSMGNKSAQPTSQGWLMADNDDDDDKKGRRGNRNRDDDDDDDDDDKDGRVIRVDLNRAKNLARQAAESANGGIRIYRAEASMHGPAKLCPYVDNGSFWTFTFLGGRPGVTTMTIESVVKVYKSSSRVVVAYNGPVRRSQQTQIQLISFTSSQRTTLVELVRGTCGCNYLISNSLRTQIQSQSRSLPPGIQKQLARGKGLPPGIAKKLLPLPKQVNTHLNLPSHYDLAVVGSNVVLVNRVQSVVVDLLVNVL